MIQTITGIGFKGLDFQHPIEPLMIFLGPNGAGKSARTQAAILALNGYIPGSSKTNAAILESYGSGDKMVVGVKIDGKLFERGFVRMEGGKVAQGFKVAGKKVSESAFALSLGEAGAPKAIDISTFMDLSAQKKIDAIFDLYPPAEDLSKLTADIEEAKEKINTLTAKAKSSEEAAARLTASRAEITLPAGSYAELCSQIRETETQLEGARKDLADSEIEAAKELGKQQGAAEERAKPKAPESPVVTAKAPEPGPMEQKCNAMFGPEAVPGAREPLAASLPSNAVLKGTSPDQLAWESIRTIINTINDAGCSACVARLVAIREMRKLEGGAL